jgi:hypothetical protein
MYGDRMSVELCENVHLHWRDLRMEFSKEEFLLFLSNLDRINRETVATFEYKQGVCNTVVDCRSLPGGGQHGDRVVSEVQQEGHHHFHYRNLRIETRTRPDWLREQQQENK